MPDPSGDRLERHSLLLMGATLVGHAANYAYHLITGRMLSPAEYGLLMALFGMINIVLVPMSALNLALSRAVASLQAGGHPGAVTSLLRGWLFRLVLVATAFLGLSLLTSPFLLPALGVNRLAPLFLAACIPGTNLLLTLTGAGLQGLQRFRGLALRGSSLFVVRALLVGACLSFGFRAAGWALLAHLLGMVVALGISVLALRRGLAPPSESPESVPVLRGSLVAFPILLAFSILMSADVVLVRFFQPEEISGPFAQVATLGRMILWLPLPIAQVMFPKVVRAGDPTQSQRRTLFKALTYTGALVLGAYTGLWLLGSFLFEVLFGLPPTPEQISWLRRIGAAMACLGPVYVVIHYELARDRIRHLLRLVVAAVMYLVFAVATDASPERLLQILLGVAVGSLLVSAHALAQERVPPPAP